MDEEPCDAFVDPVHLVVEVFLEDPDAVDVNEASADPLEKSGVLGRLQIKWAQVDKRRCEINPSKGVLNITF